MMRKRELFITWYLAGILFRLLPCLGGAGTLFCSICIQAGTLFPADIHAYWEGTRSPSPEPEPSPDPYQESIYQWDPQELSN